MVSSVSLLIDKLSSFSLHRDLFRARPLADVSYTTVMQAEAQPGRSVALATTLPSVPWHDFALAEDLAATATDVDELTRVVALIERIYACQQEQFAFYQRNSTYLQVDDTTSPPCLCLRAPLAVLKQHKKLLDREQALARKVRRICERQKKNKLEGGPKFWRKLSFIKIARRRRPLMEYFHLKDRFLELAPNNLDKLKLIAFLSIVFGCRSHMMDTNVPLRNIHG